MACYWSTLHCLSSLHPCERIHWSQRVHWDWDIQIEKHRGATFDFQFIVSLSSPSDVLPGLQMGPLPLCLCVAMPGRFLKCCCGTGVGKQKPQLEVLALPSRLTLRVGIRQTLLSCTQKLCQLCNTSWSPLPLLHPPPFNAYISHFTFTLSLPVQVLFVFVHLFSGIQGCIVQPQIILGHLYLLIVLWRQIKPLEWPKTSIKCVYSAS